MADRKKQCGEIDNFRQFSTKLQISHSSLVVTKTGIWVKISKSILEFQIKVLDNLGITD